MVPLLVLISLALFFTQMTSPYIAGLIIITGTLWLLIRKPAKRPK